MATLRVYEPGPRGNPENELLHLSRDYWSILANDCLRAGAYTSLIPYKIKK
jgi:hypothetical protein